ncbi:hypothetical protein L1049_026823 [Liquidambar formosana]|uniref:Uncharacterized protein n=1 Tax=Liquidambar formosana TaxID=63359 RepID=A0AAP0NE27_LIQFO
MPSEDSKSVKKEEVEDEEDEKSLGSMLQDRKKKLTNATPTGSRPKQSKVKKEEELDDDLDKPVSKKNSTTKPDKDKPHASASPGSRPKQSKVNKEELDEPISKKNSTTMPDKQQKKKKKNKEEEKKKAAKEAEQNGKKREKKVYDLPGQKRDPPEERDPLRIFYETLYKQVPDSEMAQFWMMESGLLPKEEAKKTYEKKLKKNQLQKLSSPMKDVVAVKQSTKSVAIKRKTLSSPDSSKKKKTAEPKVASKQSKKRKIEDDSNEADSDDDFVLSRKMTKKQRAT